MVDNLKIQINVTALNKNNKINLTLNANLKNTNLITVKCNLSQTSILFHTVHHNVMSKFTVLN